VFENVKAQESTPNNNPSAIDVGSYPVGIKMNPITNKIYVANQYSNTISVIDGSNDQIISTIKVESFPYDLTLIRLITEYMLPIVVPILFQL